MNRTIYRVSAGGIETDYTSALEALRIYELTPAAEFDMVIVPGALGDGTYTIDAGGELGVVEISGDVARATMRSAVYAEDIGEELASVTGRRWRPRTGGMTRRAAFVAAQED